MPIDAETQESSLEDSKLSLPEKLLWTTSARLREKIFGDDAKIIRIILCKCEQDVSVGALRTVHSLVSMLLHISFSVIHFFDLGLVLTAL